MKNVRFCKFLIVMHLAAFANMTSLKAENHTVSPSVARREDKSSLLSDNSGRYRTKQVKEDPQFQSLVGFENLKGVEAFESNGGTGYWIRGNNEFGSQPGDALFYRLTGLPVGVDPESFIYCLRLSAYRDRIEKEIRAGVPIIVGTLPNGIVAYVIGESYPLAKTTLTVGQELNYKNILVLSPTSPPDTFRHELAHWSEFENKPLQEEYKKDLKPLQDATYLSADEKQTLDFIIWELRGHGAQEVSLLSDMNAKADYLDRSGKVRTSDHINHFKFQQRQVFNAFGAYKPYLGAILIKVQQTSVNDYEVLRNALKKYYKSEKGQLLNLEELFPDHFKP